MSDENLKYIFANSISAAMIRANSIGLGGLNREICRSFAIGFGLTEYDGDAVFSNADNEGNISTVIGLESSSLYNLAELNVRYILDSYPPTSSLLVEKNNIFALTVNSILFGFSLNPNTTEENLYISIGNTLREIGSRVALVQPFPVDRLNKVSHPFTGDVIRNLLSLNNYLVSAQTIYTSPLTSELDLVNYNYYDTTKVFAGPNLDLLKDSENQYYYISGQIVYPDIPSSLDFCDEREILISTPTGLIISTYIANLPCVSKSDYIGPVSGVKFYREFNDGPYSSGDFSLDLKKEFINLDKNKLSASEYSSNFKSLYSYETDGTSGYRPLIDGVSCDAEGEYNINQEYAFAPISTGIFPKYQIMHLGDGRIRSQCSAFVKDVCVAGAEKNVTGFKFVLMSLDSGIWAESLNSILTNPSPEESRILKRALNISQTPYLSVADSNSTLLSAVFNPATKQNEWYFGPPQFSNSAVPFFAFTQSFQSLTFGSGASVVLYPSIGSSSSIGGNDSSRTYEISSRPILTGIDPASYNVQDSSESSQYPKASFNQTILPYSQLDDSVKLKFFGMGDSFSGKYIFSKIESENAGFFYTGYSVKDTLGKSVNLSNILDIASGNIIGSPYKTIKYISGYSGDSVIGMSKLYAHDNSGNNIKYYYFDPRLLPDGVSIDNRTGWDSFAPLPDHLDDNSNFTRLYASQPVENNFRRYVHGPYASLTKKFLYPNADLANGVFNGSRNGFPNKFKYKITIREEAVKEIYVKYSIGRGVITTFPNYISPLRTPQSNFGVALPSMPVMFSCGSYYCDFNQWDASKEFFYTSPLNNSVDNNYAPITDSWFDGHTTHPLTVSGKNASVYLNEPVFKQGILITGDGVTEHKFYTGAERLGYLYYSPSPTSVGLYHGFKSYRVSGEASYTKPLFDLSQNQINTAFSLASLSAMRSGCISYFNCHPVPFCDPSLATGLLGLYSKETNGNILYVEKGQDPFYFENIGGRRGDVLAASQGGYHSNGIIGDSWLDFSYKALGYRCSTNGDTCEDTTLSGQLQYGVNAFTNSSRKPELDDSLIMLNVKNDQTDIHTRALSYNPMAIDFPNRPFSNSDSIKCSVPINFKSSIKSFYLDLSAKFPVKSMSSPEEWYINPSGSGLVIGPFDRDVELFVNSGDYLSGYSQIYINLRKMSDLWSGNATDDVFDCSPSKTIFGASGSYQDLSGPDGVGERNWQNIRPLTYISSGETAIVNIYATATGSSPAIPFGSSPYGNGSTPYYGYNKIGANSKSYIHIRSRKTLNETEYDTDELAKIGIQGNSFWLHNLNMLNNGMERTFTFDHIDHNPISLQGKTFTFVTFSRSGKLYPKPDDSRFITYKIVDSKGNESYSIKDVEDFYRRETAINNNTIYYSGWREGSRISFNFEQISTEYGDFPYDSFKEVIPSGNCIVSGAIGYLEQADNAIFSEGISLKDMTPKDYIRDNIYGPSFVSDVLNRVPTFEFPTGDLIHPVLNAPSVMKIRKIQSTIAPEQEYSGVNSNPPANYNKLLWPALSDLRILNYEETIEDLPPDDGNTFLNSNMIISAAQSQRLPNGNYNPDFRKLYVVDKQYQMYDSIATDAIINSGYFITQKFGFETSLKQPASGILVPQGTTLTQVNLGLF